MALVDILENRPRTFSAFMAPARTEIVRKKPSPN
jgi:hypothetical protein